MRWVTRTIAALLLAWCFAMALAAVTKSRSAEGAERMQLQAEFASLAPLLPPRGTIGYVGPGAELHDASVLQVAQYALAPRLIARGLGPEFLIVHRVAASDDAARLAGYAPLAGDSAAYRVYRRQ